MKHKYVLYAIAVLLVINTGLYCVYAVKQSKLMQSVNDFIQTTNSRIESIENGLKKTVPKDEYDGNSVAISERLSKIESESQQKFDALQSGLSGVVKSDQLDALTERISNLEKVYIQHQVSLDQLKSPAKPAHQVIKSPTP